MASQDNLDQKVLAFTTDRSRTGDPYVSELLKGLVTSFKDLERKNRELEQRNAELVSALQRANEKIARLEEFPRANPELSKVALKAAAEILESAEEAVGAVRLAAKAESNDRYQEVTARLLELQRQMVSLLETAREENARRDQKANERAIDILLGSRKSILSMAEELDKSDDRSHVPPMAFGARESSTEPARAGWKMDAPVPDQEGPLDEPKKPSTQGVSSPEAPVLARSVELIASPFHTFGALCSFQQALQQLPGVVEVKARSFDKGALHLRIKHRGPFALAMQLRELPQHELESVSEEGNRIEVRLA